MVCGYVYCVPLLRQDAEKMKAERDAAHREASLLRQEMKKQHQKCEEEKRELKDKIQSLELEVVAEHGEPSITPLPVPASR